VSQKGLPCRVALPEISRVYCGDASTNKPCWRTRPEWRGIAGTRQARRDSAKRALELAGRLDLWAPLITDNIRQLAVDWILKGGNLATVDLPRETKIVALIIVKLMNPSLIPNDAEEALLTGQGVKALKTMREGRSLIYTANL
jgi:hypothetical protein